MTDEHKNSIDALACAITANIKSGCRIRRSFMKAKKCDRCGKYYVKNNRFSKNGYIFTGVTFLSNSAYLHSACMDLCDNCISDLKKFLKGTDNSDEED